MKHIKVLESNEVNRLKLKQGYHNGITHNYRIRCKSTPIKSLGNICKSNKESNFYFKEKRRITVSRNRVFYA